MLHRLKLDWTSCKEVSLKKVKTIKILIVEDEKKISENIANFLETEGFQALFADNGLSALKQVQEQSPDLILLDLMLPEIDGIQVCKILRQEGDIPIIMVTAKSEEEDVLLGLELGADDYITKPFRLRELVARIRAVLRRKQPESRQKTGVLLRGDLEIDTTAYCIRSKGLEIPLTPTEFKLLLMMAEQPGRAFTRLQLLQGCIGESFENYERTIDTHIFNLRKKLETDTGKPRYIQTVFGIGYRFGEQS